MGRILSASPEGRLLAGKHLFCIDAAMPRHRPESIRIAIRITGLLLVVLTQACTLVGYPSGRPGSPEGGTYPRAAAPAGGGTPVLSGAPSRTARSDAGRTYEVFGVEYRVLESTDGFVQEGVASWYGEQFDGRPTASGETFDMHGYSAAHRTLPLHTWIEVTNLVNGRSVILRVNDRGPFARTHERILDVSYGTARELGMASAGTARVRIRALSSDEVAQLR